MKEAKLLKRYMALKSKVEQAQQDTNKAEGALGEITKRLKKEFDCDDLNAAKRKLKLLKRQKQKIETEFEESIEEFEDKWT